VSPSFCSDFLCPHLSASLSCGEFFTSPIISSFLFFYLDIKGISCLNTHYVLPFSTRTLSSVPCRPLIFICSAVCRRLLQLLFFYGPGRLALPLESATPSIAFLLGFRQSDCPFFFFLRGALLSMGCWSSFFNSLSVSDVGEYLTRSPLGRLLPKNPGSLGIYCLPRQGSRSSFPFRLLRRPSDGFQHSFSDLFLRSFGR